MGSISHDSVLKMTDLEGVLEDSDSNEDEGEGDDSESKKFNELCVSIRVCDVITYSKCRSIYQILKPSRA